MIGYRLLSGDSFLRARSFCPHCDKNLVWYDLFPLVSYLILTGKCRWCSHSISYLYPLIECISALIIPFFLLTYPMYLIPAGFIFISAMIICIRTDLEAMLLSRFTTLYLAPFFIAASFFDAIQITPLHSCLGAITAYGFLYTIRSIHWYMTGIEGMGLGDIELICCIGSFLGISGWWFSLFVASCMGSIVGLACMIYYKKKSLKIPFGPFLALGALSILLYEPVRFNFFS
jgi:leader peptidase (prepilin peptidase) / N-methyltransferase